MGLDKSIVISSIIIVGAFSYAIYEATLGNSDRLINYTLLAAFWWSLSKLFPKEKT